MKKEYIVLSIILIFAIVLRIIFFTGINFNDDVAYLNLAHNIVEGNFKPHPYIFATRLMMIYPIAFFFLFDITEFTASLYILLTSLGSVFLAYLIGKELFNKKTGLIAAFLLAVLPLEVVYATTIVPDVPLAFFLALSVYLFIKAQKANNKWLFLFSGISIGLAWLVKTIAVIIILFFILNFIYDILIRKQRPIAAIKPYLIVVLGLLSIFILEGLIYASLGHSFLTSFIVNEEHYVPDLLGVNRNLKYYPNQLFNLDVISKYFHYIGFYFYAALLSSILILAARRKEAFILLIWLFPIILFMQYGSMSLSQYILIQRIYRFLTIISVPIVLLIAYPLANFKIKERIARPVIALILLFLAGTSFYYTYNANIYLEKSIADTKLSAKFLAGLEEKPIYADETTIGYYNILFGYKKEHLLRKLDNVKDINEIHDAYVTVNTNRGYVELSNLKSRLPPAILNPPSDWQILYIVEESDIEAYASYDAIIYYAP